MPEIFSIASRGPPLSSTLGSQLELTPVLWIRGNLLLISSLKGFFRGSIGIYPWRGRVIFLNFVLNFIPIFSFLSLRCISKFEKR